MSPLLQKGRFCIIQLNFLHSQTRPECSCHASHLRVFLGDWRSTQPGEKKQSNCGHKHSPICLFPAPQGSACPFNLAPLPREHPYLCCKAGHQVRLHNAPEHYSCLRTGLPLLAHWAGWTKGLQQLHGPPVLPAPLASLVCWISELLVRNSSLHTPVALWTASACRGGLKQL